MYIERWLKAPFQKEDGTQVERTKGTPQGGVVSPVLSNLFLHYVFDNWMKRNHPKLPFCRYADDGVYCKDTNRSEDHSSKSFDFLGFTFRPRPSKNRRGEYCINFSPAVSNKAGKVM